MLGIETGGRWSAEAVTFLRLLARCRARSAPPPLQSACISAYVLRWSALLACAAARAFASSLLSLPLSGAANVDGDPPLLSDLLAEPSAPRISPAACRSLGAEALGPREQQKGVCVCVYKKNGFIQLNSLSRHEVAILLLIRSYVDGECWEFGMWG